MLSCVKWLVTNSNPTCWKFSGSTGSGIGYLVWTSSLVTRSLGLTNIGYKVLFLMNHIQLVDVDKHWVRIKLINGDK